MDPRLRRVDDPSAWTRRDLEADRSWTIQLDDADRGELLDALRAARAAGVPAEALSAATFPLPALSAKLRRAREEVEHGRGICMLRGFPVDDVPLADVTAMYLGLGAHLDTRLVQTAEGIIVGHVADLGYAYGQTNVRGYYTRAKLLFHTDNADIVGLLCVRRAKSGGLSSTTSTMLIWNEMLAHHTEELAQCLEGFHHDVKGETLAAREDLRFDCMCEPGDIQLINDHATIHSRTEFVDHDDPAQRRLMLRLWLRCDPGRPMAAAIADRGYGHGAPRNGVPYFREDPAKDPNSLRVCGPPSWRVDAPAAPPGARA